MRPMTNRERLIAILQRKEIDRVPVIIYDEMLHLDEVRACFGDQIGRLRWSAVHKVVTPHCGTVVQEYWVDGARWERTVLYTPKGSLTQERVFEPVYNSGSFRKHYIEKPEDYEILWAYLEDGVVLEDYGRYQADQVFLGDDGLPLPAVERSPYQQLWVEWVGLDRLSFHFADCPDRVEKTIEMLRARERAIFEIVVRSPAKLINFPDNITAPTIGLKRFQQYCVPLYNELATLLEEQGMPVFVHMDGNLKPLWEAIARSKVGGIDSLSPTPDNDTPVAEAIRMWPEKRLFINFPSSVHLRPYEEVRAEAENILNAGGRTGRLEIQFSENVPFGVWRTSFRAIMDAVEGFKL